MIKARACAGDIAAARRFLDGLSPFVWRKYLDFVAVADVHAMKRQINAYRGHGEIAVEGHNIKLGRGGIREIEFFAQTQQLICGRTQSRLARPRYADHPRPAGAGPLDRRRRARRHESRLRFLRTVEHRLQMINDEQTQTLPAERAELDRFARFLGYAGRDAFAKVLLEHLDKVQRHYSRLFEKGPRRRQAGSWRFRPTPTTTRR